MNKKEIKVLVQVEDDEPFIVGRAWGNTHDEISDALADLWKDLVRTSKSTKPDRLQRIHSLFSGGPDTPCRTTWRPSSIEGYAIECVEVPINDLRDALGDVP